VLHSDTLTATDTPASTTISSATLSEELNAVENTQIQMTIMGVGSFRCLSSSQLLKTSTGNIAGGGNAVTILGGVSAVDDSGGVTKKIIKLTDLGGGFFTVTDVSGNICRIV